MSDVQIIKDASGVPALVAVVSDGHGLCYWRLIDMDNKVVGHGHSEGANRSGMGSAPMAMRNAKRAAQRLLKAGNGGEDGR